MNRPWQIRVLYDGECPLCSREIRFLERRDRGRGLIQFEDIADPAFDAGAYGLDARQLMARIHGVLEALKDEEVPVGDWVHPILEERHHAIFGEFGEVDLAYEVEGAGRLSKS